MFRDLDYSAVNIQTAAVLVETSPMTCRSAKNVCAALSIAAWKKSEMIWRLIDWRRFGSMMLSQCLDSIKWHVLHHQRVARLHVTQDQEYSRFMRILCPPSRPMNVPERPNSWDWALLQQVAFTEAVKPVFLFCSRDQCGSFLQRRPKIYRCN